ncbi:hypothetical protein [Candidatus Contubernalis alkaliaceticus]|uniref:hypothetical protein n=1 Tax=Candidatus Contubernalis alkaliaceticus TaxID=338645 RepID=UPI001F4C26C8|nr:hypothetical protein [Candidatus Contubernalis alkalaceticus]UNC91659.1 hypothetical protein HUE98_05870 [Candidatus Contubernalis alkalaceticus]
MLQLSKEEVRELSIFLGYIASNHEWAFSGNEKVYKIMEKLDKALDEVEGECQEEWQEPVENCQGCGADIYPGEIVWVYRERAYCARITCLIKSGLEVGVAVEEITVEDWLESE